MATKQQLTKVLRQRFADIDTGGLERTPSGRIVGVVVSDAFATIDHEERQKLLWEALDQAFPQEQLSNVGPIATLSFLEAGARQLGAD